MRNLIHRQRRAHADASADPVQRTLRVGAASDAGEAEADDVAAQVKRRLHAASASTGPVVDPSGAGHVQRRVAAGSAALRAGTIQRAEEEGIEMTTFSSNVPEEFDDDVPEVESPITSAVKVLKKATDEELSIAIDAYLRAKKETKGERGGASGSATAEAQVKGEASAAVTKTKTAITALVKAGALAEATLTATGKYERTLGSHFAFLAEGKMEAYARASATASAKLEAGLSGISLEASAEAGVAVGVSVEAASALMSAKGKQIAKLSGEGEARAAAEAKASGTAKLTSSGLVLEGKFEAFAGVEAKGSVKFVIGPDDSPFVKAVLRAGVNAGVGAKGGGSFKIENGEITLSADLAATLGIGASTGFDIVIGYKSIAAAIYDGVAASFAAKESGSNDIEMDTFADHSGSA